MARDSTSRRDPLKSGVVSDLADRTIVHPVEKLIKEGKRDAVRTRQHELAEIFGAHVPLRMRMEQEILSQFRRLPGLDSHFIGLETLAGLDEKIDVQDYMGLPEENPNLEIDTRAEMESKLRMPEFEPL